MIDLFRESFFNKEGRDILPFEYEYFILFSPNGKYGAESKKIKNLTINNKFISNLFDNFANNHISKNFFCISDISYLKTEETKKFHGRPGDIIYILEKMPENKKLLNKLNSRFCLGVNELFEKTGSFALNTDITGVDFELLSNAVFLILKSDETKYFIMLESFHHEIHNIGLVTSDKHIRLVSHGNIDVNIPSDCWTELFDASPEVVVSGDINYFNYGFLNALEAINNSKASEYFYANIPSELNLGNLFAYKMGFYYAERRFDRKGIKALTDKKYNNLNGKCINFLTPPLCRPPYSEIIEFVKNFKNRFGHNVNRFYMTGLEDLTGFINRLLGIEYVLEDAIQPMPELPPGSIIFLDEKPFPGSIYLGKIVSKDKNNEEQLSLSPDSFDE